MAYIDVKITDLSQISSIKKDDLFLISHPLKDSDGAFLQTPYSSNSISGGALSSTLREMFETNTLCVSTGDWHFHTTIENLPTQDFKLQINNFINALETSDKLTSIVHDDNANGWYHKLSSSFLQNPDNRSGVAQSLSVLNNSIPNVDFVERAIAGAYQSLLNQLTTIITPTEDAHFVPSHVGEIVHSTTLEKSTSVNGWKSGETVNQSAAGRYDAAIRKRYGYGQTINGVTYPDTAWILHSGYFLRGADSGVSHGENHNVTDAGQDSVKMTTNHLIEHNHTLTTATTKITATFTKPSISVKVPANSFAAGPSGNGAGTSGGKSATWNPLVTSSITCSAGLGDDGKVDIKIGSDGKTNNTGKSAANITPIPTIPQYKRVYIWERIA